MESVIGDTQLNFNKKIFRSDKCICNEGRSLLKTFMSIIDWQSSIYWNMYCYMITKDSFSLYSI